MNKIKKILKLIRDFFLPKEIPGTENNLTSEFQFVKDNLTIKLKNEIQSEEKSDEEKSEGDVPIDTQLESPEIILEVIPEEVPYVYSKEELIALEKKEINYKFTQNKNFYTLGVSISGKDHSIPKVINNELVYRPCQDYHAIDSIGQYNFIICADGAGSAENSNIGSQFISDTIMIKLKRLFDHNLNREEWEENIINILYDTRNKLKKFSIDNNIAFETLASTVNVTVYNKNTIYYAHIGDGRSCYLTDTWHSLITPWKGNEANHTVFITSNIWNDPYNYIKFDMITDINLKALCVLTDGCETHSYTINKCIDDKVISCNEPFLGFYNPVLNAVKNAKLISKDELEKVWVDFIDKGNPKIENELDDKTMIISILND
jgi:hypothetical protein